MSTESVETSASSSVPGAGATTTSEAVTSNGHHHHEDGDAAAASASPAPTAAVDAADAATATPDLATSESNPSTATVTTPAASASASTAASAASAASASASAASKNLELTISSKALAEFPTALMLERVNDIVKIDATDNQLTSLSSLPSLPRVHTLILDKNRLTSLDAFQPFPALTTLWLNNNQLANLADTLAYISRACPNLTYLSMLRNPCCPNMYFSDGEAESYQRYRIFVIYRLPSLCYLDATPVTPFEREEAASRGKFYAVSRPSEAQLHRSASNLAVAASLLLAPSTGVVRVGFDAATSEPPKVTSFLGKGRPRYDGSNSEGNRFIVNDDL